MKPNNLLSSLNNFLDDQYDILFLSDIDALLKINHLLLPWSEKNSKIHSTSKSSRWPTWFVF